jgi:hypothetical protein
MISAPMHDPESRVLRFSDGIVRNGVQPQSGCWASRASCPYHRKDGRHSNHEDHGRIAGRWICDLVAQRLAILRMVFVVRAAVVS